MPGYGEWLNIWQELFGPRERGYDIMIGNVPELYTFSKTKDRYRLYIPLRFWFCNNSGLALPLISLQYTDVKIVLDVNDFDKVTRVFILSTAELADLKRRLGEMLQKIKAGKLPKIDNY